MFNVLVRYHGLPGRIVSDLDTRFIAKVYRDLFARTGTNLSFSPSYHPIYNSENERSHGVINDALRSYVNDLANWEDDIPMVEFAFNNHINIDTGYTPFELDCGQQPLDPLTVQLPSGGNTTYDVWREKVVLARETFIHAQQKRLEKLNSRRRVAPFKEGQQVLLSTEYLTWKEAKLRGKHLRPRWTGPVKILHVSKNGLSVKIDMHGKDWKIHDIVPVTRIKPYYPDSAGRLREHLIPDEPELIDFICKCGEPRGLPQHDALHSDMHIGKHPRK